MATDIWNAGLFSISEAARYTDSTSAKLRYWFRDPRKSVFRSAYADSALPSAISFLDLIEALVVADFRKYDIPLKHIREVHDIYVNHRDTIHPFATKLFKVDVAERRLVEEIRRNDGKPFLVDALKNQGKIQEVIESDLRNIEYNRKSGLAERWAVAEGVTIDPKIRLGKPVIKNTRLNTSVIASQYLAYDHDAKTVAEIYNISEENVRDAIAFEKSKGTVKFAA